MYFLKYFLVFYLPIIHGQRWDYENYGPDYWQYLYDKCGGDKQSPINIDQNQLKYDFNLKPFIFHNYDSDLIWNFTNNGETCRAILLNNNVISLKGSDLNETYYLKNFHFHWGYNNFHGSEHFFDSKKFPLEMHLLHQSLSRKYHVLSFLFEINEKPNQNLNYLLEKIISIQNIEDSTQATLALNFLLPLLNEKSDYYRYVGSLTTPPCDENVAWSVFEQKISISVSQMQSFRINKIRHNFRDTQLLNNRKIYKSCLADNCLKNNSSRFFSKNYFQIQSTSFILMFIYLIYAF